MKKSKCSEEQIVGILREGGSGMTVKAVCATHNISDQTYYKWKRKYGGMEVSEVRKMRALSEENSHLKRIIADLVVLNDILKAVNAETPKGEAFCPQGEAKVVSPSSKRRAVQYVEEAGLGRKAQACRALGLVRSAVYRLPKVSEKSRVMRKQIVELSEENPRYGYRRITALLRRRAWKINAKRVQRVRRMEGFKVSKRQRKMRRMGSSTGLRQQASHRNEVWSWDFVEDQTEHGSKLRFLTLIDEHTRQCLAIHAAWSIRAVDVITVVEAAIERYGRPEHIRSDNGPEFIAYAIQDWLKEKGVKTLYIKPGSPWQTERSEINKGEAFARRVAAEAAIKWAYRKLS